MMKLLLTNDDGIDAPGIAALGDAVEGEIYIAAPHVQRSECGHQVTTRESIEVVQRGERAFAVKGTPADCVRLALRGDLFAGVEFDWILSGINEGGNLGVDIHISGTVAAVREATILGRRAIAFSHYRRANVEIDWQLAADRVRGVFEELRSRDLESKRFWNVNLPHGSDEAGGTHVYCAPCRNPLPVRYESRSEGYQYSGVYADREGEAQSDVVRCFGGDIAISKIAL
jgi:5'-nucleotidase